MNTINTTNLKYYQYVKMVRNLSWTRRKPHVAHDAHPAWVHKYNLMSRSLSLRLYNVYNSIALTAYGFIRKWVISALGISQLLIVNCQLLPTERRLRG